MGILVLFYGPLALQEASVQFFPGLACLMAWRQFETICLRNPRCSGSWEVWCLKAVMREVTLILVLLISPAQP